MDWVDERRVGLAEQQKVVAGPEDAAVDGQVAPHVERVALVARTARAARGARHRARLASALKRSSLHRSAQGTAFCTGTRAPWRRRARRSASLLGAPSRPACASGWKTASANSPVSGSRPVSALLEAQLHLLELPAACTSSWRSSRAKLARLALDLALRRLCCSPLLALSMVCLPLAAALELAHVDLRRRLATPLLERARARA